MKLFKLTFSPSQIKALLHKDILVRWRQPWMTVVQLIFPCMVFMLLYLIRLKFGPEEIEDCQFPTRQLPTKNSVLPAFHSYICSIENKCMSTKEYEEYSKFEKSPLKPIVDIVQMFINNDNMFNSVVELPSKANFLGVVFDIYSSGHWEEIGANIGKVVDLVPQVERWLNGSFDITRLFSDRRTFVKGGYLICGHPFPNTDTIPLVNDILYSEDFSEVNDDELKAMPTKYCKKLYLDVTSINHGKLVWNVIKPLIHGKILYAPDNEETNSIMQNSNTTFEELNRLKILSVSLEEILIKLRTDKPFNNKLDELVKLTRGPIVKQLIGDSFDVERIEEVLNRIRNDPIIFDVISTIKNILECFSVDRFIPLRDSAEVKKVAYDLTHQHLFFAGISFNKTNDTNIVYNFHMDTDNTQPTIENKNRFWFPGPSSSMVRDMKYHRGFVQIKHALDMGIIKYKKKEILKARALSGHDLEETTTPKSPILVHVFTDDTDDDDENEEDDEWFTNIDETQPINKSTNSDVMSFNRTLNPIDGLVSNLFQGFNENPLVTTIQPEVKFDKSTEQQEETTTNRFIDELNDDITTEDLVFDAVTENPDGTPETFARQKRQTILDSITGLIKKTFDKTKFEIDNLQFYTKQFPYPSYIHDDFKTGLYLAQAIQVAFYLGLISEIASCVRHRIWMRESRNTMIMRSMGLKPCSEMTAWMIITYAELVLIFFGVTFILYIGGILFYTKWLFVLIYLLIFGASLISFCYMCSTFFTSATIGAVAAAILFFITYCPYIIVLLFDARLTVVENFFINLSFTTAFSHGWTHIMRMELQQIGLSFDEVFREGLSGEFGFAVFMIVLDTILYFIIGYISQRYKEDEFRFIEVQRADLDPSIGATLSSVSKIYDEQKIAVSNISLTFNKNQVTCLLGRNGAGKSTIIKMLTGQVVQTTGRVVLSQAMKDSENFDKIGVCSQDNILIPNLTAREHLEMYAKIKVKNGYKSEVEKTLKNLNFGKYESYEAYQLSGGYQRRLCVAIAFIGSPNVVILDEPCNGVDSKARKDIWELIERLRKGRAVVFATHFLDEAEYLSDAIVIMKNGKIIAHHSPETLKNYCTATYEITMQCCDTQTVNEITEFAAKVLSNCKILESAANNRITIEIPYDQPIEKSTKFLRQLQELQIEERITELEIESQNLDRIFKSLDSSYNGVENSYALDMMKTIDLKKEKSAEMVRETPLKWHEAARHLLGKRLVHFSRNYRMLLCVLILPAIFELLAMWFVAYRIEDDFDKVISLSRDLYPHTTQALSIEKPIDFTRNVYNDLKAECSADKPCQEFSNSERVFYWILETLKEYHEKRYGGYTFNDTKTVVWYNNKGYHAMMAWLNDLNTHLMQKELNDTSYSITAYNEPWKLGFTELSTSSILRQAGDSCMVFILLLAFCLVVASASVYLVNERMKGEKLQQKLCGVNAATYWGVAFLWDFLIILLAILVCIVIIVAFGMPVFVARQQLWGIIVLSIFFGYACIPAVHVFEKCFTDSSVAIVTIFCMNVIIPLTTMALIVLLGVVGDSSIWDDWRYFLNRLFLIFPQHALGDGLLEVVKNYMVALMFRRYDIDSYKNPINSDLLQPHLIALFVVGTFFIILNILIESGVIYQCKEIIIAHLRCLPEKDKKCLEELKILSIQNTMNLNKKCDNTQALIVENLCKAYKPGQYAVKNVSFSVQCGECFGLLGKNGAGKSTIFKMLSGQLQPDVGHITFSNREISYCPQTDTLDSLLTVKECIEFYGRLRRINNLQKLVDDLLQYYQLEAYRDVLVKNLSGGNRRKLTVATTCCGRTTVVLMDEPTSDMDPVTRAIVYRTIDDLLTEKRAIVLTSHSISEIEEICQRIGVLKEGYMITSGSPENLKAQFGSFYNVIVFCDAKNIQAIEKDIHKQFPRSINLQLYAHSIKFSVKIHSSTAKREKAHENGNSTISYNQNNTSDTTLTFAELFQKLDNLSMSQAGNLRYAVSRCRLDAVFERILDTSDNGSTLNGYLNSTAVIGSPSVGYIHNGYVETETVT